MSWAIQVEKLSKLYALGGVAPVGSNLREDLMRFLKGLVGKGVSTAEISEKPEVSVTKLADHSLEGAPAGHFWALRDLSVEINQGDVLGVIGRNGAGKSTFLKVLSRITAPSSGSIKFRGRMASLLEVGTGFHRELTGRENIFLNGSILGMRRGEIASKLDEIVEFAEIGKFLDTPVKYYSSGMYVRLAFAVAANLETDILVVDEVLAVGDAQFQKKCMGKMEDVATKQGRTVLFVSHQMSSVRRLCNRGLLMERGRSAGMMSIEEAIKRYNAAGGSSAYELELGHLPRANDYGRYARITSLKLAPGTEFMYGDPLHLVFTLTTSRPLRGVFVGTALDNLEGTRMLTLDSDNSEAPLDFDPGTYEVHFHLERNPLHPGPYSLGCAIMSGPSVIDALRSCATWEVQSGESDVHSDRGPSGIRLPVGVQVNKLSNPVSTEADTVLLTKS
jgi:lipopolysaccharide transport system ATP-binding protein